jgi:hypothetical protein
MKLRKSSIVLLIALVLLFAPAVLSLWIGLTLSDDLIRAAELAITLLTIFLGARYELQHLERKLREERQQEVRRENLDTLDYIESWLDGVSSAIEDITVLTELSEKDESDGALIIPTEKWKPIEEELLRLETRGYTVLAKLANCGDKELIVRVGVVWAVLNKPRESFAEGVVVNVHPIVVSIAEAMKALGKARVAVLEQN